MIKATIQNSSVAFSAERIMHVQEIRFPCSETELSKKLGEIGMNPEHLAPMATVLDVVCQAKREKLTSKIQKISRRK